MKKSLTVSCVIMASGLSRRFGANKLLADFCGQPMLCRAFAATAMAYNIMRQYRETVRNSKDFPKIPSPPPESPDGYCFYGSQWQRSEVLPKIPAVVFSVSS